MENFRIEWINEYLEEEGLLEEYYEWLENEEDTEEYRREFLFGEEFELNCWCKAKGYIIEDEDSDYDYEGDYADFIYHARKEEDLLSSYNM